MILPASVKLFLATQPTDMRKGFNRLPLLVEQHMKLEPLSGHLFIFFNRKRDQIRILFWDHTGYWIYSKRLVRGVWALPAKLTGSTTAISLDSAEFLAMLEGICLTTGKRKKRFRIQDNNTITTS